MEWKVTKHLCKSVKWDIIRKKRDEMLKIKQNVEDNNKRMGIFSHLILFYLTIFRFRKKTNVRVIQIIKRMKFVFMINMMKMKIRRKLAQLKPTTMLRNR